MLKRKIWLMMMFLIVFFGFVFSKGVNAENVKENETKIKDGVLWRCNNPDGCSTDTNLWWDKVPDSGDSNNPFEGCSGTSINTALGCIPVEIKEFVPWLLKGLFGIAGGIAFLLMVYGFILIATSGGDEKKVAGAKETITSALIGLLVCIFSIFILRLIAVNILKIPGI